MATVAGVDFMNRKQLRQVARNLGISFNVLTTNATLIAAIKAK